MPCNGYDTICCITFSCTFVSMFVCFFISLFLLFFFYFWYVCFTMCMQQPTPRQARSNASRSLSLLLVFDLWFVFQCSFLAFVFLIEFACNIFQRSYSHSLPDVEEVERGMFVVFLSMQLGVVCTPRAHERKQWKKSDCSLFFWCDVA